MIYICLQRLAYSRVWYFFFTRCHRNYLHYILFLHNASTRALVYRPKLWHLSNSESEDNSGTKIKQFIETEASIRKLKSTFSGLYHFNIRLIKNYVNVVRECPTTWSCLLTSCYVARRIMLVSSHSVLLTCFVTALRPAELLQLIVLDF